MSNEIIANSSINSYWYGVVKEIAELHKDCKPLIKAALREYIDSVEDGLFNLPQEDLEVSHQLLDGMYIRTLTMPENLILTGRIHKTPSISIVHSGILSVLTENGATMITGPFMFMSAAGVRRLGRAHSPVVMSNIFRTTKETLDEIEDELFAYEYLEEPQ